MSRKKLVYLLIGVLLAGLVAVTIIKRKPDANTLKLGSVLVLSGDYKSLGEQVRDGQVLAMNEINSSAGKRHKVDIEFYDSQGEKTVALEKVKTLQRDGVKFIAEVFGSPSALHSMPYIGQQDMLFVSGVNTGASLTKIGGKHFFRIIPSDRLACQQLSKKAIDMGYKKAAVIYVNDEWGSGLKTEFEPEYERLGGKVVTSVETGKGQDIFQPVVANLKAQGPQLVLLFVYPREAALFIKEARKQQLGAVFMGTDNLTGSEVTEVGGDAVQGVMYVVPSQPKASPQSEHFKQLYTQNYGAGKEPPVFAALGYDVVHLLAKVSEESGGDVNRARQILENIRYEGASGPISFDINHELVVTDYQLKVYRKVGDRIAAVDYQPEMAKE